MAQWTVQGLGGGLRQAAAEDVFTHLCFTRDEWAAAVAKGRGALDVALGETFVELCQGDRLMELGCSRLVDYAYERLGLPKRTTFMLRGRSSVGIGLEPLEGEVNVKPIANARVTVFYGADYRTVPLDDSTVWQSSTTTDEGGYFALDGTCSASPVWPTTIS